MPTPTFIPIAKNTTVNSTTDTVTFSVIPNTYTDLAVFLSLRFNDGGSIRNSFITFINTQTASSTDSNFTSLYGSAGAVGGSGGNSTYFRDMFDANGSGSTADTFSNVLIYIPNYANTSTWKTWYNTAVTEQVANNTNLLGTQANLWRSTAAINQLVFRPSSGIVAFASGCTFDLYGISNA